MKAWRWCSSRRLCSYNPNLTISGIAGYAIPDQGDDAWAATIRTQFAF
jgi:hypothetical protein